MEAPTVSTKAGKVHLPLVSLQAALAKISPALPGASCGIPVLRNVRIENTEQGTTFIATDLDLSMRATLPRMQDATAPFLLSSERLIGYSKLLEGADVTISPGERRATLKCGRSTTQLPLDAIANYPQTPFDGGAGEALMIPQAVMLRMLRHTNFAVSVEESRYTLGGSLLDYGDGRLRMVATDGHRLAVYTVPMDGAAWSKPSILPLALLKALAKALEDTADLSVSLSDADTSLALAIAGEMPLDIVCRKLAGVFPNWQAVMPPGDAEVRLTVNSTEMLASITRCVAMSDRASLAVRLTISPGVIVMRAVDSTAGETEESINVTAEGVFEAFVTGFNGQYLVDVLKASRGDVRISFAKASGRIAMLVASEPEEGEQFQYVAMPMRV